MRRGVLGDSHNADPVYHFVISRSTGSMSNSKMKKTVFYRMSGTFWIRKKEDKVMKNRISVLLM